MNENETIAGIVAEMRDHNAIADYTNNGKDAYEIASIYADRIEAAAKRETHWDERETLRNALAENAKLKARLRAIHDAVQYDGEHGSCGAHMIDSDDYRDSWFDGIEESEVAIGEADHRFLNLLNKHGIQSA